MSDQPTAQPAPDEAGLPSAYPGVSVVMPVLDEERHLRQAVTRVLEQDYPGPVEVVVALGPSRDRTDEVAGELAAEDPRVRLVANPTGATGAGLNRAVAATRHDVVVRLDGHALVPPDYVRVAVETLTRTGADNVGGVMAAAGDTDFERAVAAAMTSPIGVGQASFHTGGVEGPAPTVYLGVFRKEVLRRLGGYDESFLRAQDWELNHRIREGGGLVWFTPLLTVSYRPRSTLRALARQYRDYGRWRRVVMREHGGTASLRYLAPPVTVLAVVAGAAVGLTVWRPALLAPLGYAVGVLVGSALVGRGLPWAARAWLPVVLPTMHGSWGIGFLTSPRGLRAPTSARR
jgi:succinoglycan biosynthesis protein ExoA